MHMSVKWLLAIGGAGFLALAAAIVGLWWLRRSRRARYALTPLTPPAADEPVVAAAPVRSRPEPPVRAAPAADGETALRLTRIEAALATLSGAAAAPDPALLMRMAALEERLDALAETIGAGPVALPAPTRAVDVKAVRAAVADIRKTLAG